MESGGREGKGKETASTRSAERRSLVAAAGRADRPCEAATEEKDGLKKETKNGEVHEHGQAESSGPPHQLKKKMRNRTRVPKGARGNGREAGETRQLSFRAGAVQNALVIASQRDACTYFTRGG